MIQAVYLERVSFSFSYLLLSRFCGSLLSTTSADTTTGVTVYTEKMPFKLGVYFDQTEVDTMI